MTTTRHITQQSDKLLQTHTFLASMRYHRTTPRPNLQMEYQLALLEDTKRSQTFVAAPAAVHIRLGYHAANLDLK